MMRIGLALGAGGILGGAWTSGALAALADETGWEPATAACIVGTSSGAVLGALTAADGRRAGRRGHTEVPTEWRLLERLDLDQATPSASAWSWPRPGSPGMALAGVARRTGFWPAQLLAGLMPAGPIPLPAVGPAIRTLVPRGWVQHPACWIVACDYATGARVVFGQPGSPKTDIAAAAVASSAVPGIYQPVTIRGRRYVDGGLHSMTNLDLLQGLGLDLVLVLNPLAGLARHASLPRGLAAYLVACMVASQLALEADLVRQSGTDVVVLEPEGDALAVMSWNLMDGRNRREVVLAGLESVRRQLRRRSLALVVRQLRSARRPSPPVPRVQRWSWRQVAVGALTA